MPNFAVKNVADRPWVMECTLSVERTETLGGATTERRAEFSGYAVEEVVQTFLGIVREVTA